jgi:Leucine-rich repeat (LRR) protein
VEQFVEVTRTKKTPGVPDLRGRTIQTLCLKRFDAIPDSMADGHVERLLLSKCKLSALPASLSTMRSLRSIRFVDCELAILPKEAFTPWLDELSLFFKRDTLITQYPVLGLPDPLPKQSTLTKLQISGYHVPAIPESITNLPALEQLVVIPRVRTVPKSLAKMRALKKLNLLYSYFNDFAAALEIISRLPLTDLTLSNTVVDDTTEAAWRRLGVSVEKLLARSYAMVAPGAGKEGPKTATKFDVALLQTWMPRTLIHT